MSILNQDQAHFDKTNNLKNSLLMKMNSNFDNQFSTPSLNPSSVIHNLSTLLFTKKLIHRTFLLPK